MKPLETALHAASLTACAALAVGLWNLKPEPPAPAAASAALPTAADPKVGALESELESLRLRVKELEASRGASSLASAPAAGSAPSPAAATLLAALDDPKVQEKLRASVLPPGGRFSSGGGSFPMQVLSHLGDPGDLFQGMELNPMQKDLLEKIVQESQQQIGELFGKLENKTWTKDQARDELARRRADADARAKGVLTEAQFKTYQDRLRPLRMMTDARLDGGKSVTVYHTSDGVDIGTSVDPDQK